MTRGDKAALRLTIGLGLAVFVAYGIGLQAPFFVCIMAFLVLCKPGPPLPVFKALVITGMFAALVAAGVLMVPLLEHYAATGVLLTPVLLFALLYMGQLHANPLTTVLVLAFTLIPVAGVMEQALVGVLAGALAVGVLVSGAVTAAANALFPDPPAPASPAAPADAADRENARWVAWRGTLIVMPVFVLALRIRTKVRAGRKFASRRRTQPTHQRPMRRWYAASQRSPSLGLVSFELGASKLTFRLLSACCLSSIVTAAPALLPVMRPVPRSALPTWIPASAAAPSAASQDRSKLGGADTVVG